MIGIAYTTHNRPEQIKKSLEELYKYLPEEYILEIIDDASTIPVKEATFRFEQNVGIARAKNKCIELLYDKGCTEFFLFDDDTYPKHKDWYKPYIESTEPHLMYIFKEFDGHNNKLNDTLLLYEDSKIKAYSHARGCMLYFNRKCFDTVGGMNTAYGIWGFEHSGLSQRIYNARLTTFKFMDVVGSKELIHSMDEYLQVKSTVPGIERIKLLNKNRVTFNQERETRDYMSFREEQNNSKDIIISTYFNNVKDTQRGVYFKSDKKILKPLIQSLKGQKLIILNDCFGEDHKEDNVEYIKVETSINPYFQRWISILQYLKDKDYDRVFCVDATDVIMLNNPFNKIRKGKIYTGDEETTVGCKWMIDNHKSPLLQKFFEEYSTNKLLNAGLLGGYKEEVVCFISKLLFVYFDIQTEAHFNKTEDSGIGDMGVFNYVCYTYFKDKLQNGRIVNTPFKSYKKKSIISWFAHK